MEIHSVNELHIHLTLIRLTCLSFSHKKQIRNYLSLPLFGQCTVSILFLFNSNRKYLSEKSDIEEPFKMAASRSSGNITLFIRTLGIDGTTDIGKSNVMENWYCNSNARTCSWSQYLAHYCYQNSWAQSSSSSFHLEILLSSREMDKI